MKKNRLFGLVVVLGVLMGFADLGFAVCDCNNTLPVWYLPETKCQLEPFYYKAEIDAVSDWFLRIGDPDSGSVSGSCTEYWKCIKNNDCEPYSCGDIESTHSWENDSNDLIVGLGGFESDCYSNSGGVGLFPGYNESDYCVTGSWDSNNIYTGNESFHGKYYQYGTLMISEDYTADISITPEFDRNNIPQECLTEPNITINDYQPTMFVRAKDECCCESSNEQLITIYCAGAAHMKATMTLSGDSDLVIMDDSKWEKGCYVKTDGTRACSGSGWIKITPNHDNVILENNQPKSQTVIYMVAFYDSAGNYINQGSVSVTLLTKCLPEPK